MAGTATSCAVTHEWRVAARTRRVLAVSEELIHTTVLLSEAVDALAIKPDGIYVDCTFGRGGHSALILQRLNQSGRLIALDKDMAAVACGRQWKDARFHMMHS